MTDENDSNLENTSDEQTTEQTTDDSKKVSTSQQVLDAIKEKLDSGYELKDRNSKLELNKIIRDTLKLPKGWHSDINKAIKEVAIEKKLAIADLGFKNEIDGVTVNLVKSESESTAEPQQTSPHSALPKDTTITGSPRGALPKTTTEQQEQEQQTPEKKYMSESAQERLIKKGLNDFLVPIYISLGVVEPDESEKEDEAQLPTAKKFRSDVDKFSTELNEYLIENNIKLPQFLNHLSIIASIVILFVLPVVKFKFFSSKQTPKPKYDDKADNIEVTL